MQTTIACMSQLCLEMVDGVKQNTRSDLPRKQVDLNIAALAWKLPKADAAKAMIYSQDVQRLRQKQGELVAQEIIYGRCWWRHGGRCGKWSRGEEEEKVDLERE